MSLVKRVVLGLALVCLLGAVSGEGTNGSDDPEHTEHESAHNATVVLMFMFFGIGVGALLMQVLSHCGDPLPYTCVVFFFGLLFSLANKDSAGIFGQSVAQWTDIDPHLLLYVFLPPLIFGEAMSLNYYNAKGALSQALILAGPGVVIGATLLGAIAKYMLHYNWSWNLAMIFGSIMACTDPVAVVALLKSAGASPKLTIIIVGESLLNDGTAMVMFNIFNNCFNGQTYSIGQIVSYFFSACLGAAVFGAAMGYCAIRWLRRTNRPLSEVDVLVQIAITLCCAYTTFFVAENTFGISGVLACVGAGAVISWLGPPIILNHETMHHVWGMIEWSLNTMLFMHAGLIIGNRVFDAVIPMDWFYLFVFYVLVLAVRSFVLFVLFPFFSRCGHQCTVNEAIFMSWGGLRGSLSMTLALIVYKDGPADMAKETSRLFFYVGGVAALTLVVNAPLAQTLLGYLDLLDKDTTEKSLMMAQITKKLRQHITKVLGDLAAEFHFTSRELEEVAQCCSLLNGGGGDGSETAADVVSALHGDSSHATSPQNHSATKSASAHQPRNGHKGQAGVSSRGGSLPAGTTIELKEFPVAARNDIEVEEGPRLSTFTVNIDEDVSNFASQARPSTAVQSLKQLRTGGAADEDPALVKQRLLAIVRGIFFSIVRVHYWHEIEQGKLPRKSKASQLLLYSVEKAQDKVNEALGARDWACIKKKLDFQPLFNRALVYWEEHVPPAWRNGYASQYLNKLECNAEEREVYLLTSFISAQAHAQHQLHLFISGDEAGSGTSSNGVERVSSAEELQVIAESQEAVAEARRCLEAMNIETVAAIRTKQAAAMILNTGADLVQDMERNGLLATKDAQDILATFAADLSKLEQKRRRMYTEHGSLLRNKRIAQRETRGRGLAAAST